MGQIFIVFFMILSCASIKLYAQENGVFPFKLLMGHNSLSHAKAWKNFTPQDLHACKTRKRIFKTYYPRVFQVHKKRLRIPKKLHLIWVGPHPFPEKSKKNIIDWQKLHPDWEFIFWTDSKARNCPVDGMVKRYINKKILKKQFPHIASLYYRTVNYGEKADLLRYHILYNEGGVYVDHDCKPFKSFTQFLYAFDFFAGTEFTRFHKHLHLYLTISNSIIGACQKHPIFHQTIEKIHKIWDTIEARYPEDTASDRFERVIARTFDCFSQAAQAHVESAYASRKKQRYVNIIFPTCFFFANNHFSTQMRQKLMDQGYIFSSHQYASLWLEE